MKFVIRVFYSILRFGRQHPEPQNEFVEVLRVFVGTGFLCFYFRASSLRSNRVCCRSFGHLAKITEEPGTSSTVSGKLKTIFSFSSRTLKQAYISLRSCITTVTVFLPFLSRLGGLKASVRSYDLRPSRFLTSSSVDLIWAIFNSSVYAFQSCIRMTCDLVLKRTYSSVSLSSSFSCSISSFLISLVSVIQAAYSFRFNTSPR